MTKWKRMKRRQERKRMREEEREQSTEQEPTLVEETPEDVQISQKNENMETTGTPSREKFKLKAIAMTAPNAAPLETPSVKGAARSFRSRA